MPANSTFKTFRDTMLESMLFNHSRGCPTIGQLAMDWKRRRLVKYHSTGLHFLVGTGNNFFSWKILVMTQLTVFKELPICLRKWMQNYNSVSTDILYQLKYSMNHYMKMQKHAQSLCCLFFASTPVRLSSVLGLWNQENLQKLKKSSSADQLITTLMNSMMDEVESS